MHLDLDHSVALARLATPALDVEAESSGLVASRTRLRHGGEDLANRREQACIGRRIGAGRASDRTLVDLDHAIDVLEALDPVEVRRARRGAVELRGHRAEQGIVHQRGLAGTGNAADAGHEPERKLRGDVLQIVGRGADHSQHARGSGARRFAGISMRRRPLRYCR